MREVQWERMFPDELEQAFAACPVVYFTYGLCEPHGPQNTLGLDELKAHAIACQAARHNGGIVAPADYWHIHEIGLYAAWAEKAVGRPPHAWLTAIPTERGLSCRPGSISRMCATTSAPPMRWASTPPSC